MSPAAIEKRPSVTEWIGRDLVGIACGVLAEMLEDKPLQRAMANREIACILATTRSVLQTAEHPKIGAYRTTIGCFFHEGTLYSDAVSVPASASDPLGYRAVADGRGVPPLRSRRLTGPRCSRMVRVQS